MEIFWNYGNTIKLIFVILKLILFIYKQAPKARPCHLYSKTSIEGRTLQFWWKIIFIHNTHTECRLHIFSGYQHLYRLYILHTKQLHFFCNSLNTFCFMDELKTPMFFHKGWVGKLNFCEIF